MMINCIYAKGVAKDYIECRNSAKSHLHRLPVDNDLPPLVESMPHARQTRIEEWLKED